MNKITNNAWKIIGIIIVAVGLYSTVVRFTQGLKVSTNLSDAFPWGMWIGFDILCGVGLAAGGFTICAAVYIFNLEKYHPLVRPSVLTAFLGYVLVIFGLLFDLGKPYNVWHAIIMWNPRSVMFEVAWCVMLYTTVLFLEFSPVVFEGLKWQKLQKFMKAVTRTTGRAALHIRPGDPERRRPGRAQGQGDHSLGLGGARAADRGAAVRDAVHEARPRRRE